jgi:hypothetical protein
MRLEPSRLMPPGIRGLLKGIRHKDDSPTAKHMISSSSSLRLLTVLMSVRVVIMVRRAEVTEDGWPQVVSLALSENPDPAKHWNEA